MKPIPKLLDIENDLYEEFERCATQLCDIKPEEDWEWEWYFLMQHHGVPTRLLDWTDGALIALHFAVRDKHAPVRSDSLVYVLDPYWLMDHLEKRLPDYKIAKENWGVFLKKHPNERFTEDDWDRSYLPDDEEGQKETPLPKVPILFDSTHVTRRIAAQRSRFMIFGNDPKWMAEMAARKDSHLQVITIPAGSIKEMRLELRDAGVTESVIFPDLDGLGRELKQIWEERR
jgi:hypothetical protein